jgi:Protein of unknown function (DUF3105)
MAKKRKPRRPTGDRASVPSRDVRGTGGANPQRRERKEEARQAREAARKRARRAASLRRAATFAVIAVVGLLIIQLFQRAANPRPIPREAVQAAQAAGCSIVETPEQGQVDRSHLDPGASYTYTQHPATSGPHDPSPLGIPPRVYPAPIPETKAVHNLEHGAVIIYYRSSGDGALSQTKVDRMTTIANAAHNAILAPYDAMPDGTALAFAAWNKLQTCPANVSGPQATTIAKGFLYAFLCTGNAPESQNGEGC